MDENFFNKNEIDLNKQDIHLFPDVSFTLLRHSLLNYYSTSHTLEWFIFRNYILRQNGSYVFNDEVSHKYLIYYSGAINNAQIFFEFFIKGILSELHIALIRAKFKSNAELLSALRNNFIDVKLENRAIKFYLLLNRLEYLIQNRELFPAKFKIKEKYSELVLWIPSIRTLSTLRNAMVHGAEKVLNAYSFELLFSNYIIPLVNQILSWQEKRMTPMDRNVACGLNVLQEIQKIYLPTADFNDVLIDKILNDLKWINHLKELGRASFQNPLYMYEFDANKEGLEKHHNFPIRSFAEIEAKLRADHLGYDKVFDCPCCGTNSLCTHDRWRFLKEGKSIPTKAKCIVCSYEVNYNMGEPMEFGIMNKPIFV